MLKARYNFVDISVLSRTDDGEYINLTDYTFTSENEKIKLNLKERFAIMFCSFFKKERYAAGITVPELLMLADIKNQNFTKQIEKGVDKETSQQLIAIMCAKKIIDYDYGRCINIENTSAYAFQRHKIINKKHVYSTVLTKEFQSVS